MPPLRTDEANQIVVSVDGGDEILATEQFKTKILPEVFVFSGQERRAIRADWRLRRRSGLQSTDSRKLLRAVGLSIHSPVNLYIPADTNDLADCIRAN